MSNKSERKRKRRQTERTVLAVAILIPLLLVFITGGIVYAKYYAESYQKGIAIASGVYFTANHAFEVEDADKEQIDENKILESVVDVVNSERNYSFNFEVRNYENNLLFNEGTVVIPYTVSFWLEGAPVGATYTVTYNKESEDGTLSESKGLTGDKANRTSFSGHSIAGGKAMANKYTIDVTVSEGAEHTQVPVYVEVKTEAGAVVNKVLRGKMVLSKTQATANYIESQQFVVSKSDATDTEKFEELQNKSGLTYEIRTVGEVATDGVTEELKLTWNPEIYEIDLFDDAYADWKNRTSNDAPLTETRDGKTWCYITLEVMPYSAQTVNFFRGQNFGDESHPIDSMDDMYQYIKAELQTSNEVTSQ